MCHLYANNFHIWWKFDKILTKIILHSFLDVGPIVYVVVVAAAAAAAAAGSIEM